MAPKKRSSSGRNRRTPVAKAPAPRKSPPRSGASRGQGTSPTATPRSLPGWAWLLVGGVLASLIWFAAVGRDSDPAPAAPEVLQPQAASSATETPTQAEESPAAEAAEQEERHYEFYDLLMRDEVTVPDEPRPAATRAPQNGTTTRPAPTFEPGHSYQLQAGSFRRHEDAERLRAQLALVGLPAKIHSTELDNGQTWHRVRVGPFTEAERLKQAQGRMEAHNIQPLLVRHSG